MFIRLKKFTCCTLLNNRGGCKSRSTGVGQLKLGNRCCWHSDVLSTPFSERTPPIVPGKGVFARWTRTTERSPARKRPITHAGPATLFGHTQRRRPGMPQADAGTRGRQSKVYTIRRPSDRPKWRQWNTVTRMCNCSVNPGGYQSISTRNTRPTTTRAAAGRTRAKG